MNGVNHYIPFIFRQFFINIDIRQKMRNIILFFSVNTKSILIFLPPIRTCFVSSNYVVISRLTTTDTSLPKYFLEIPFSLILSGEICRVGPPAHAGRTSNQSSLVAEIWDHPHLLRSELVRRLFKDRN